MKVIITANQRIKLNLIEKISECITYDLIEFEVGMYSTFNNSIPE